MPTYEYKCSKGHEFELFQKMSDDPAATCPECGEPAERLISGGMGFLFKGEGFYITDYRSDDYKKKAQAESPGGDGSSKSKDKKGSDSGSGGGSSTGSDSTGSSGGSSGSGGSSSGAASSSDSGGASSE